MFIFLDINEKEFQHIFALNYDFLTFQRKLKSKNQLHANERKSDSEKKLKF